MEFKYVCEWSLRDKEVGRIDESRARLNFSFSRYLDQFEKEDGITPSYTTLHRVRSHAGSLRARIKKSMGRDLPHFDALVLMDVAENIRKIKCCTDFFDSEKKDMTLGSLLAGIYGNGAYSFWLRTQQNKTRENPFGYPHAEVDRYDELMYKRICNRLKLDILTAQGADPDFAKLQERLRKEHLGIPTELKRKVTEYLTESGIAKDVKGDDFYICYRGNEEGSQVDFSTKVAEITSNDVYCWKNGSVNRFSFFSGLAFIAAFHELANHVLLARMTDASNMPVGLRATDEHIVDPVHSECIEGTSPIFEGFAIDYLGKHRREFGMSKEELEICQLALDKDYALYALESACGIQRLQGFRELRKEDPRARVESNSDGSSPKKVPEVLASTDESVEISRRMGLHRLLRDPDVIGQVSSSSESFVDLSYLFGRRRYQGFVESLKSDGVPKKIISSSLLTGIWTSRVAQEEFIRKLYVPWAMTT